MDSIIFKPEFQISEVVYSKLEPEIKFHVISFLIHTIDYSKFEVVRYSVGCSNADGIVQYFLPFEIEHSVPIEKK